jgi:hypothetical protein
VPPWPDTGENREGEENRGRREARSGRGWAASRRARKQAARPGPARRAKEKASARGWAARGAHSAGPNREKKGESA